MGTSRSRLQPWTELGRPVDAEIIAAAAGKPLDVDDGIIECDFGGLEGTSIAETMKTHGLRTVEDLVSILPPDYGPSPG